jgi:hypothetical protein
MSMQNTLRRAELGRPATAEETPVVARPSALDPHFSGRLRGREGAYKRPRSSICLRLPPFTCCRRRTSTHRPSRDGDRRHDDRGGGEALLFAAKAGADPAQACAQRLDGRLRRLKACSRFTATAWSSARSIRASASRCTRRTSTSRSPPRRGSSASSLPNTATAPGAVQRLRRAMAASAWDHSAMVQGARAPCQSRDRREGLSFDRRGR